MVNLRVVLAVVIVATEECGGNRNLGAVGFVVILRVVFGVVSARIGNQSLNPGSPVFSDKN